MPILTIKYKGNKVNCLYDSADHELISRFKWNLHSQGYIVATYRGKNILMHRLILGVLDKPQIHVDHINHNKRDNRRENLRECTPAENRQNSRKFKGKSVLKGVYKDGPLFHVQIRSEGRARNLGRYKSEITAGRVYDREAKDCFKEFAFLNFPDCPLESQLSLPGL